MEGMYMPRDVTPEFHLTIENLFFEYDPAADETIFTFSATLMNRGAASVALGWDATLTVGDINVVMTRFLLVGEWVRVQGEQRLTVHPRDQLSTKTCERRILRGGARMGRLFFKVPGNWIGQIQPGRFQVEVSLKDYLGNKTSAVFGKDVVPLTDLPVFDHESLTVKDSEQSVTTAPVSTTTIQ
jgi:hypothetical protein